MDGLIVVIALAVIIIAATLWGTDSRATEHGTAGGHRTATWW